MGAQPQTRANAEGSAGQERDLSLDGILGRGRVLSERCPSREILSHLTSRWGVLVLIALLEHTHRFSELRRKVGGVSEKMLAQTLQTLEADGFVLRQSFPVVPPHVEYSLTPLGEEAALKVRDFVVWVEDNIGRILEIRETIAGVGEGAE
ncbi:winged helix-turn-helix transcriptional regulator [Roseibium litorale]|uniref:Helix-turn-helix transcriptional regulator n=1 Tax=Roseibium litorale TaxID=2803841 RepID=A0ABR9CRP6_9HYPH|nr:helix-turn-helix domain-containing protein [Roseibium litorale]MBD8893551.1 helix-turn-helix transcriptional regulator [Roseibium litorale]